MRTIVFENKCEFLRGLYCAGLAVKARDLEWEKEIKREKRGITAGMLVHMRKTSESHWPDELFF